MKALAFLPVVAFAGATFGAVATAAAQTPPTAEKMKCAADEYVRTIKNYPVNPGVRDGKFKTVYRCQKKPR